MRLLLVIAFMFMATATWAEPQNSCSNADALGVSRVAEIDTTGGPRFGEQYPGDQLLQPGEVVLTFDDGPFPNDTKAILDALATQCTKAIFFNVGSMSAANPDLLQPGSHRRHPYLVACESSLAVAGAWHWPDRNGLHRGTTSAGWGRRAVLPISLSK